MVQLLPDLLEGEVLELLVDLLLPEVGGHELGSDWPRLCAEG